MSWDPEFLKQFAPSEDKWKCPICLVLNDKDNEKCRSCENPNPNAKLTSKKRKAAEIEEPAAKVAKTETKLAASTTTTASSVFNFGTAATTSTTTTPTITPNLFNFGPVQTIPKKEEEEKKEEETKTKEIKKKSTKKTGKKKEEKEEDDEDNSKQMEEEDKEEMEEEEEKKEEEEKQPKSKKSKGKNTSNNKEKTTLSSSKPGDNNNKLYMMGSNEIGQLGLIFEDEDEYEARIPTIVEISNCKGYIIQLSCGDMHTIALSSEGMLYSWGCNDKGALGRDGDEKTPLPIKSEYFDNTKIESIGCGSSHSLILNGNGEIYSWGIYQDDHGDIGYDDKNKIMLRPHKIKLPKGCKKAVYISSGGDFTMFISDKGNIYGMGNNEQFQLGRKTSDRLKKNNLLPHLVSIPSQKDKNKKCNSIYCGKYHCICILENGNVYGWGQNTSGQLGVGDYENREKPSLITFYNNEKDGNNNIKKAKEFGCGMHFSICLCEDGKVYGCGATSYGKLGLGDLEKDDISKSTPVLIPKLSNIKNVAVGSDYSLAINDNGELYCWGFNETFQLGTGEEHDELEPRKLEINGEKVVKISCGTQHSGFITEI